MIENDTDQNQGKTLDDAILTISRPAAMYLLETSKWTSFLSILGFIFSGLIAVVALFAGSIMATMTPGQANMPKATTFFIGFIYLMMGILYFFPSWYLYQYTRKLKAALSSKDSNELIAAFENQKSLYKFWGIFTIVLLAIYAIILLFALVISSFR
jgi:hypothetical protein